MYLIKNGILVLEDRLQNACDLLISGDRIERIAKEGEINPDGYRVIDAAGSFIAPGFIDIHSDYIEHMASPRPSSVLDLKMALREAEKQLINQGITTMYHSLSLYKESIFTPKKIRTSESVKKLVDLIEELNHSVNLINHRFHARYEIDNVDEVPYLIAHLRDKRIHLLSFMDHTPGQGQYRDLETYKATVNGYCQLTECELAKHIAEAKNKEKLDLATIMHISKIAQENGVTLASHDDDSLAKLNLVKSLGTTISEFPVTMNIARGAKERGMFTVAGAPNVLLGGSHSGNLSAKEAIKAGCIDILCSDYYPASLLHAVFLLEQELGYGLAEIFKLITINPAKALGLSKDYGSLAEGKKADLVIIAQGEDCLPMITSVWVDGQLVSQLHYSRRRVAV
ncbi:MAG: Alpha-D-ribose 1-methylphosphonate 5-triphosphate diphosphatase [Firmicutes bacterium]|nr:Alpha-D-ribose 1-methylphosphonate 5-triphosphate diphosphatase [Bacillota bacterium]